MYENPQAGFSRGARQEKANAADVRSAAEGFLAAGTKRNHTGAYVYIGSGIDSGIGSAIAHAAFVESIVPGGAGFKYDFGNDRNGIARWVLL